MISFADTTLAAHALKCELATEVLCSSGQLRLRVTGWSMLPSVWPGDTLMIERTSGDAVSAGDIVLFGRDRRLFAHRVVAKSGAQDVKIITQGDGMPRPDPAVTAADLLGKVSYIVRNGRLLAPNLRPSLPQRAIGALVGRSYTAARIVAGIGSMQMNFQEPVVPCQS